ncbi:hypothetical protein CIW52_18020 [Mycolicibacterium sp. P9-64]|uniref:hypothetical protein n=1 Tax=Mycolicibacterium sp. P9-64 TaxID=2024612 RepID=UPI0011EBB06E|nr:hypothetical protein [Mycolicibacterium sp. P9-64]KAA0081652.1 hypothetical protein CIW52_18020 [Mycolicibacterium sp. P9-64]
MSIQVSAAEYARRGLIRTGAVFEGVASVLISAWEVVFATAAVRTKRRAERRTPRSRPGRLDYLEDSAMCREMYRL